jgi:hypothetical protein
MTLKILDATKNCVIEPCKDCHELPQLVCEWIDDDSFIPDEPDESYPIDDYGWQHARPVDMNTHRVFALGLRHECGEKFPFQIVKYFLMPRAFNLFPDNLCLTLEDFTKQIAEWDAIWTKEYISTVNEWNSHFGEISGLDYNEEEDEEHYNDM